MRNQLLLNKLIFQEASVIDWLADDWRTVTCHVSEGWGLDQPIRSTIFTYKSITYSFLWCLHGRSVHVERRQRLAREHLPNISSWYYSLLNLAVHEMANFLRDLLLEL